MAPPSCNRLPHADERVEILVDVGGTDGYQSGTVKAEEILHLGPALLRCGRVGNDEYAVVLTLGERRSQFCLKIP